MEIVTAHKEGRVPVTVFHIKGEISAETSERLQQQAQDAFEDGTRDLLLDLSKVTFLSSAGLRAIHYIFMLLRTDSSEEGTESVRKGISEGTYRSPHLKLLNPNRNVLQVLKMAGFDMFLEIHSKMKAAINSF
ncbi:STAS domain-containing protein [Chloroflexota bacterium]